MWAEVIRYPHALGDLCFTRQDTKDIKYFQFRNVIIETWNELHSEEEYERYIKDFEALLKKYE